MPLSTGDGDGCTEGDIGTSWTWLDPGLAGVFVEHVKVSSSNVSCLACLVALVAQAPAAAVDWRSPTAWDTVL